MKDYKLSEIKAICEKREECYRENTCECVKVCMDLYLQLPEMWNIDPSEYKIDEVEK